MKTQRATRSSRTRLAASKQIGVTSLAVATHATHSGRRRDLRLAVLVSLLLHSAVAASIHSGLRNTATAAPPSPFQSGLVTYEIEPVPVVAEPVPEPPQDPSPATEEAIAQPAPNAPAPPDPIPPLSTTPATPQAPPPPQESSLGVVQTSAHPLERIMPEYPTGARIRGEEGIVRIHARLSPEGRVLQANVESSSAYRALDLAALTAMRRARFYVPPGTWNEQTISLSFQFRLE